MDFLIAIYLSPYVYNPSSFFQVKISLKWFFPIFLFILDLQKKMNLFTESSVLSLLLCSRKGFFPLTHYELSLCVVRGDIKRFYYNDARGMLFGCIRLQGTLHFFVVLVISVYLMELIKRYKAHKASFYWAGNYVQISVVFYVYITTETFTKKIFSDWADWYLQYAY